MSTDNLAYATIAEVAPRLAAGEISPVELTRACLDRIDRLDGQINAFITLLADSALNEAIRAEQEIRRGGYRGPLHGIPIAHKDLFATRSVRTTAGSSILADVVPDEDATVVARLRQSGSILLGKLNMHEFAAGGTNENRHYGAVHNPWDLRCIPGGSSGGSAAALAAGMCLAATGSDTAGSIRIPSALCGTTGIKPTYGRVSCSGAVPLSWSLDHAGPMTRGVEDAALLLNVMAAFDTRDSASVERPPEDFGAGLQAGVGGVRIGIPHGYFDAQPLQADVARACSAAAQVLVDLGATPVDVEFWRLDDVIPIGQTIVRAEMTAYHQDWYAARPQDYPADMRERFEQSRRLSAIELVDAQRARERIRAEFWAALELADVLVTPTTPMTATPIGASTVDFDGRQQPFGDHIVRFTYPFNLTGWPALSIPCGFDRNGLPIGLQLAARPWREALLFRVGHAYQQATDWHQRRPALAVAA
jgi:aspartyl-tRNA(Asn)/glutamyl-tRNA(Gln) amidotransferase subunit A